LRKDVVALDLERTLIDDAFHGRARPGLRSFLEFCDEHFSRVVIFTTVEESVAREVLADLAAKGFVPRTLRERVEYIDWSGEFKDLRFIPDTTPEHVWLVDDDASWIRPEQRSQWIAIAPWDDGPDEELQRLMTVLIADTQCDPAE
jgi:hypothetical protein